MRIFLSLCMFCSLCLFATNAGALTLSGRVISKQNIKPLKGVTIGVDELRLLANSDSKGRFEFKNLDRGEYHLHLSSSDYEEKIILIRLKRNFHIEVELEKTEYILNKTKNIYYRYDDRYGAQSITRKNIEDLPMRGAGDSLHLLQSLPGVGGGFVFATVPIIRGSNPLYDRYYVDDIPVDFPYHYVASIIPVFSSINEEVIDKASVIKGLAPMYYDDNLGNIIKIKTRSPEHSGVHGKINIDPIVPIFPTVSVSAAPYKDFNLVFTGRRSLVDVMTDNNEFDFYFQDHYLKLTYNLKSKHRISFIDFGSYDYLSYDEYKTKSRYNIDAVKWEYVISRKLFLKTILSRYTVEHYFENIDIIEDFPGIYYKFNPVQRRLYQTISALLWNFRIKTGYEIIRHENGVEGNVSLEEITDLYILDNHGTEINVKFPIEGTSCSYFSEIGYDYNPFWINFGFKLKRYGPLSNNSLSYRAMFGFNILSNNTVYAGGGLYHAHPDMYYYLGEFNPDFNDIQAINSIIGIKFRINKFLIGQIEFYNNNYQNLIASHNGISFEREYKTISQIHPFSIEQEGNSRGGEFFLKGEYENYYGWISYAYSISKRDSNNINAQDYCSDFDQTHIFRLVLSSKIGAWSPSIIVHYYSSLPYTPIIGSAENNDEYDAVYGENNSERFSNHQRIDGKLTYSKDKKFKIYIEIWNVLFKYNKENDLYQRFDENEPYGQENPEVLSDFPYSFFWIGMELCF